MNQPLICLDNVRCRLDRHHHFQQLSWRIYPGQHWAILGRNGAGKTALAQLIAHRLALASGTLSFAPGFDPRRDIAWVSFEQQKDLHERDQRRDMSELSEAAFDPGTTARQAMLQGQPAPANFTELCRRYGISALLETGIRYLSSGEMRKILILRGLLQKPRLLILDEPLEGLDRQMRREIAGLLEDFMVHGQQTLLLARRKADLLAPVSHTLLLDNLELIAAGSRTGLEGSPAWQQIFPPLPGLPESLPAEHPEWPRFLPDPHIPLIEGRNLSACYQGKTVLAGVNLTVSHGQQTALSGPNGCGKSTLLNMICGENHKAYGQHLVLFGQQRGSGETLWQVKSRFGVVSNQIQARYIRGWNALEVVISGLHDSIGLYQDYGAAEQQSARAWLEAFRIGDLADELFHRLSYGQQRIVLLARAMVSHPPVLVLDEPCTGLDDYNREWFLTLVDHIVANSATHILYVSHLRDELPRCINRELEFRPRGDGLYDLQERQPD